MIDGQNDEGVLGAHHRSIPPQEEKGKHPLNTLGGGGVGPGGELAQWAPSGRAKKNLLSFCSL